MATITFGGTTIWDDAAGGVGFDLDSTPIVRRPIVTAPDQGDGVWLKRGSRESGAVGLALSFVVPNWTTPVDTIAALVGETPRSLVTPIGTFAGAVLQDVDLTARPTLTADGYRVELSCTFLLPG